MAAPEGLIPDLESGDEITPTGDRPMKGKYGRRGRSDKRAARELLAREGRHPPPPIDVFVRAQHQLVRCPSRGRQA